MSTKTSTPPSLAAYLLTGIYMLIAGACLVQAFHSSNKLGNFSWAAVGVAFACVHVIAFSSHTEKLCERINDIWRLNLSTAVESAIDKTIRDLGPIRITEVEQISRDNVADLVSRYKARYGVAPRAFLVSHDGARYLLKMTFPGQTPGPHDRMMGIPFHIHYSRSHAPIELV